jgi:hypothetical protein
MIAKRITIARQEKREIIHKQEVTKLSQVALDKLSENYLKFSKLEGLDFNTKLKVKIFLNNIFH